ncbi:MAG: enoyl-CoA hydratase [Gammaproteobacteria bacterium]|nr:enoyl-CoA hydratase [Gammaproteobacteria bacterium]
MKEYKTIILNEVDTVAILKLNRPDKLNAFNMQMFEDILNAIDFVNTNDNLSSLVLTGSGKAFCAGADLSMGEKTFDKNFDTRADFKSDYRRDAGGILTLKIYNSLKPVIAACNGDAVGVGATMQLAADIRLAAKKSRFGFVFAKRGIVPDGCASWFLPKIVGISKALELCYSGNLIDAEEAFQIGLVNYLVDDEKELIKESVNLAKQFSVSSAPVSVAMTRHMLWTFSADPDPENAHIIESKLIDSRGLSEDAKEGVMSFLEKRKPNFKNKISTDFPSIFPWRKSKFKN